MKIKVNGKILETGKTKIGIPELLIKNNVERTDIIIVRLNGKFIKPESYNTVEIRENDEIDFLYPMGGGGLMNINIVTDQFIS